MADVLLRDGLTVELLKNLSYKSELGISLKKDLRYFNRDALFSELKNIILWYDQIDFLSDLPLDFRIKSFQSAQMKYFRYFPDHQARKVFDDMLGFRSFCDDYNEIMEFVKAEHFRIADMSNGKSEDDGYRGIHIYFQCDNRHYPIEIQYNTFYDRQFNNWLHKYTYKRDYPKSVGCHLRREYEIGTFRDEEGFKEVFKNVLSYSKRC